MQSEVREFYNLQAYYSILQYIQRNKGIILPYSYEPIRSSIKLKHTSLGTSVILLNNPQVEETSVVFAADGGYFEENQARVAQGISQLVAKGIIDQAISKGADYVHRKAMLSPMTAVFEQKSRNRDIVKGVELLWGAICSYSPEQNLNSAVEQIDQK